MALAAAGSHPANSATLMEKVLLFPVVPAQVLALKFIGPIESHMPSLSQSLCPREILANKETEAQRGQILKQGRTALSMEVGFR